MYEVFAQCLSQKADQGGLQLTNQDSLNERQAEGNCNDGCLNFVDFNRVIPEECPQEMESGNEDLI